MDLSNILKNNKLFNFFRRHRILRDVLFGFTVGLLIVGGLIAAGVTFGAATPLIGIGIVLGSSLFAGAMGILFRFITQQIKSKNTKNLPEPKMTTTTQAMTQTLEKHPATLAADKTVEPIPAPSANNLTEPKMPATTQAMTQTLENPATLAADKTAETVPAPSTLQQPRQEKTIEQKKDIVTIRINNFWGRRQDAITQTISLMNLVKEKLRPEGIKIRIQYSANMDQPDICLYFYHYLTPRTHTDDINKGFKEYKGHYSLAHLVVVAQHEEDNSKDLMKLLYSNHKISSIYVNANTKNVDALVTMVKEIVQKRNDKKTKQNSADQQIKPTQHNQTVGSQRRGTLYHPLPQSQSKQENSQKRLQS